jgi:glyoxylase-like metal-dependent hydrolase (beta-lactamase superfamily II)
VRERRERGRGQRILDGVWRLRLPLPWPGVPHGNAFAIRSGDGIVLVDTGIHEPPDGHPGSWDELRLALSQVGLRVDDVRLLVCTHAHSDHYGQAAPIVEAAGCELWMHPNHAHMTRSAADPERWLERRLEIGLQSGVPRAALDQYREARRGQGMGVATVAMPDRDLLPGVTVETDLGPLEVHETPGHAPSHVCLYQPERGILISGDHLLGRVSPYYDFGYTPDPAGEFLASLDSVEALDARLCLSGHGRPFRDVRAHVQAWRDEVLTRIEALAGRLDGEPRTAFELLDPDVSQGMAQWAISETLAYLTYLEARGRARREDGDGDGAVRWRSADA